jgi:hypothetical protein
MVLSKNPFRKDIFLTLEGQTAQITPAEITFAGKPCRRAKKIFYIKTQKVSLLATIISISIERSAEDDFLLEANNLEAIKAKSWDWNSIS